MAQQTFTTEDGAVLRLRPVAQVLLDAAMEKVERDFRQRGEAVDTPTQVIVNKLGEKFEVDLNADHLDMPGNVEQTAINEAKWRKHDEVRKRLSLAQTEARVQLTLGLGVEYEIPESELEAWKSELAYVEKALPVDPRDQKVLYLVTKVLSATDAQLIVAAVQALSATRALTQEKREVFFRNARAALGEQLENALEQSLDAIRRPAGRPAVSGTEGAQGMESQHDAKPVG